MKDRFKFRFWHKPTETMYAVEEWRDFHSILKSEATILMQSTGLKDKYGILIYEGDILDLYVSTKKLYRYQVKYEIGSFMLVSNDEIFDFPNKWNDNVYPLSQLYYEYENEENRIYECQVVGNIYEDQELLGGANANI